MPQALEGRRDEAQKGVVDAFSVIARAGLIRGYGVATPGIQRALRARNGHGY